MRLEALTCERERAEGAQGERKKKPSGNLESTYKEGWKLGMGGEPEKRGLVINKKQHEQPEYRGGKREKVFM